MKHTDGLDKTFDAVASAYDALRPTYPDALYRAILDYVPLSSGSAAVEVGSGSGQATESILKTGCALTAIEQGEALSEILRHKFCHYPDFTVTTARFEDATLRDNAYDLVFSATAFHWIDEQVGYPKVYAALRSGGAFARFANHPYRDKGNPALAREIDAIYSDYYDTYHNRTRTPLTEYTATQAEQVAMIAARYGFTDIRSLLFTRTRRFTATQYTALLGTYSDHIAIEAGARKAFFGAIEDAIDRHGGVITVYDTIDLALARKP